MFIFTLPACFLFVFVFTLPASTCVYKPYRIKFGVLARHVSSRLTLIERGIHLCLVPCSLLVFRLSDRVFAVWLVISCTDFLDINFTENFAENELNKKGRNFHHKKKKKA